MRRYSREQFSNIAVQNPLLEIVANLTSKHTGVSIDEMKGPSKAHHIVVARMIFANACRSVVFPQYYIPYYLNKHDAALQYWYDTHEALHDTDVAFAMLSDKIKDEFNNKIKSIKDA